MTCLLFKPWRSDSSVLRSEPKVNITEAWCCGCILTHDVDKFCHQWCGSMDHPPRTAVAWPCRPHSLPGPLQVLWHPSRIPLLLTWLWISCSPTLLRSPLNVSFSEAPHPIVFPLLFFSQKLSHPDFIMCLFLVTLLLWEGLPLSSVHLLYPQNLTSSLAHSMCSVNSWGSNDYRLNLSHF